MRPPLLLTGALSSLVLSLASLEAAAAPPPGLDYRAPAGCPDVDSFVAAVEARGASFAAATGGAPRQLLVSIEAQPSGFAGHLQLQAQGEASGPRRVHAASCAEVSDALAVVTAIALQREEPSAPAPAPATPAPVAVVPPVPIAASAPIAAPVQLVMSRKEVEVSAGKLVLDYIATHTLAVGAQFGAIRGLVLPRLDYTWSRTNTVTTPDDSSFVLGNEFRVHWTVLGPIHHRAPGYETLLFGVKAGVGGCTPLFYDPLGLTLKVCSEFAVGAVGLDTRNLDSRVKVEKSQGLATAGFELDAHYNLSQLLHINLRLGAEAWANRISAERDDGSRLFQSRFVNGYASVGIGIHF